MERLLMLLGDFSDPLIGGADSFADRLSCSYTVFVLGLCALSVTTTNYIGEPVSCWCPPHFTDAHKEYTNRVKRYHIASSFETCHF